MLDEDLGLEIEPGIETEELVPGPRVAICAAVLAAAVGVNAKAKTHVGTVVLGNEALRLVREKLSRKLAIISAKVLARKLLVVLLGARPLEAILRRDLGAAADKIRVWGNGTHHSQMRNRKVVPQTSDYYTQVP